MSSCDCDYGAIVVNSVHSVLRGVELSYIVRGRYAESRVGGEAGEGGEVALCQLPH